MEQWVSGERTTSTISHSDPSLSLLLLVSFVRGQRRVDMYICPRTARTKKYENTIIRFN
jgi:hypothetical protein